MKRALLIVAGFLLIGLLIGAYFLYFKRGASEPAPVSSVQFPTGSTGGTEPLFQIQGQNGTALSVKDFVHNGETIPDPNQAESYQLAGSLGYCNADGTCPTGAKTEDFSISYSAKYQFFNIVLLAEPLSKSRIEAEQFLMSRLGLTQDQLCELNYALGTTVHVNSVYGGEELRFSFCPGAIKLP